MTSRVLGDLTLESQVLTPSVNALLVDVLILSVIVLGERGAPSNFFCFVLATFYCFVGFF
jgi:hypothetical protein